MPKGTVLAFDFGLRYIGIAIGELNLRSFRPLETIETRDFQQCLKNSYRIVKEWDPVVLVVGLPLNRDGTEQPMTQHSREFAQQIESLSKIKTVLVDERFTSLEADSRMKEEGLTVKQRAQLQHAHAATVILQSYLESQNNE